VLKEFSSS